MTTTETIKWNFQSWKYNIWNKKLPDGFTSIIHTTEEKINKLEDIAVKAISMEAQTEKSSSNNGKIHSDLWITSSDWHAYIIGVQKDKKKGSWTKNMLAAIVAKIFWNSMKTKSYTSNILINPWENKLKENHSKTHHHKIAETHDKDETLKVAGIKRDSVYRTKERVMEDFLSKTL